MPQRFTHLVVLGASAGGLNPLVEFFSAWIPDRSTAFVVIQHLSPDHPSVLGELIGKHTSLPIRPAADGTPIEGGAIYLIQPGDMLHLRDDCFSTTPIFHARERWRQKPIDVFLHDIAEPMRDRGVAIILSGTGSDGGEGVQRIADAGGLVMIQDPSSAQFDGMPLQAIATGVSAICLPPGQLADHLHRHLHGGEAGDGDEPIPAEQMQRILDLIQLHTRRDFHGFKRGTLERRLRRRMAATNLRLDDYLVRLDGDAGEATALAQEFLIRVTSFFRDPQVWDHLAREILPRLVQRRAERKRLRLWTCGCSTGEEAYTLGMLVQEALRQAEASYEVTIFATDIDTEAIGKAGGGLYPPSSFDACPAELRERYTRPIGSLLQIVPVVRQSVVFSLHDALQDPPFTDLDLVLCRNLLIYYGNGSQSEALNRFAFSLTDEGFLVLGASESVPVAAVAFEAASNEMRIYRRLPRANGGPLAARPVARPYPGGRFSQPLSAAGPQSMPNPIPVRHPLETWWQRIAAGAGLVALVIDGDNQVQHSFGDISGLCRLAAGSASLRINDLVVDRHRHQLLAALHQARETGEVVVTPSGVPGFQFRLESLAEGEARPGPLLIQLLPLPVPVDGPSAAAQTADNRILELRVQQLETACTTLQASLDQALERTAQVSSELQSTNEELLSSNEELQSTNEELQSVNEELYTVNAELQEKIRQVELSNHDLSSLIEGAQVCAVFCDQQLRIRRISSMATRLLGIQPDDLGRPLAQLAVGARPVGGMELRALASQALERLERTTRRIELPGHGGVMVTMLPFAIEGSKPATGLVLTFLPLGEIEHLQSQLEVADQRLRSVLLNILGVAVLVFDRRLRLVDATGGGLGGLDLLPRDLIGRPAADLFAESERADARRSLEEALAGRNSVLRTAINGRSCLLRLVPGELNPAGEVQAGLLLAFNLSLLPQALAEAEKAG